MENRSEYQIIFNELQVVSTHDLTPSGKKIMTTVAVLYSLLFSFKIIIKEL